MEPEAVDALIDYYMTKVYTAFPGVVVGKNFTQGSVDVKIAIDMIDQEGNSFPRPTVLACPLIYPSSSTTAITFPVEIGDTVLLVFSARSMDAFKGSGASLPNSFRMHHPNDAVAIPGLFPFNKSRTIYGQEQDALVLIHNIGKNQCEIHLKSNGDIFAKTPTKYHVQCAEYIVDAQTSATITSNTVSVAGSGNVNISSAAIGLTATGGGSATMSGRFNMNGQFYQTGVNSFNGVSVDQHKHLVIAVGSDTDLPH